MLTPTMLASRSLPRQASVEAANDDLLDLSGEESESLAETAPRLWQRTIVLPTRDPVLVHQTLEGFLQSPSRPDERRRYLWKQFDANRVLVRAREPDLFPHQIDFNVPPAGTRIAFEVTACPREKILPPKVARAAKAEFEALRVLRPRMDAAAWQQMWNKLVAETSRERTNGRAIIHESRAVDWFLRRAAHYGLALDAIDFDVTITPWTLHKPDRDYRVTLSHFEGVAVIADHARFRHGLANGFGSMKPFGHGMMLFTPLGPRSTNHTRKERRR